MLSDPGCMSDLSPTCRVHVRLVGCVPHWRSRARSTWCMSDCRWLPNGPQCHQFILDKLVVALPPLATVSCTPFAHSPTANLPTLQLALHACTLSFEIAAIKLAFSPSKLAIYFAILGRGVNAVRAEILSNESIVSYTPYDPSDVDRHVTGASPARYRVECR